MENTAKCSSLQSLSLLSYTFPLAYWTPQVKVAVELQTQIDANKRASIFRPKFSPTTILLCIQPQTLSAVSFLGFCLPHAITYQALSSPAFQRHLCSLLPTPLPMKFRLPLPHAYMSLTSSASPHLLLQAAPYSPCLPIQLLQLFPCLQGAHHRLPTASSTTSQNHGI